MDTLTTRLSLPIVLGFATNNPTGSAGCTLTSAVAAGLAHGLAVGDALHKAQEYPWQQLAAGFRPGRRQSIPDRFFRAQRHNDGHV